MTSLTLVSLFLLASVLSTASAHGGLASCCRSFSKTQVHRDNLKDYYKQNQPPCPIPAVVFTTIKGKRICSNPTSVWAMTSMAYLDGKNWQTKHANLY
nr:C-C motif chemokine 2 [Larimichthys crocea]